MKKKKTDLFYHFVEGFLSVFWLAKPSLPSEKSDNERDMENLQTDWMNIGKYIHNACEKFKFPLV
ncbi:MAG: hypothetical protein LBF62_05545 [Tannerellaceae bacterium]|nr:hypothetical protein [Tannerellaceae bacterium]